MPSDRKFTATDFILQPDKINNAVRNMELPILELSMSLFKSLRDTAQKTDTALDKLNYDICAMMIAQLVLRSDDILNLATSFLQDDLIEVLAVAEGAPSRNKEVLKELMRGNDV